MGITRPGIPVGHPGSTQTGYNSSYNLLLFVRFGAESIRLSCAIFTTFLFCFSGARTRTRLTPVFIQRLFEEVVTYRVPPPAAPLHPLPSPDDLGLTGGGRGGGQFPPHPNPSPPGIPAQTSPSLPLSATTPCPVSPPRAIVNGSMIPLSPPGVRTPPTPPAGGGFPVALRFMEPVALASDGDPPCSPARSEQDGGGGRDAAVAAHGGGDAGRVGDGIRVDVSTDDGLHGSREGGGESAGDGKGARTEGEMDYKTFLDLVLAMENKQTPQVCWRVVVVMCLSGRQGPSRWSVKLANTPFTHSYKVCETPFVRTRFFSLLFHPHCKSDVNPRSQHGTIQPFEYREHVLDQIEHDSRLRRSPPLTPRAGVTVLLEGARRARNWPFDFLDDQRILPRRGG